MQQLSQLPLATSIADADDIPANIGGVVSRIKPPHLFAGVLSLITAEATARNTQISEAVIGLYDDRGNFDARVNTFPTAGGSGASGAIKKGDIWLIKPYVATSGPLVNSPLESTVRALTDSPGQTAGNWAVGGSGVDQTARNAAAAAQATADLNTSSRVFASGILTGYTAPGSAGTYCSFALDFTGYTGDGPSPYGGSWKLVIDGVDYGQGCSGVGALPGSLTLPSGWSYSDVDLVRTVTCDTLGAHTVSIAGTSVAPSVSFLDGNDDDRAAVAIVDFGSYSGGDYVYYSSDAGGASVSGAAGTALNLSAAGWASTTVGAVVTLTAPDFARGHSFSLNMSVSSPALSVIAAGAPAHAASGNVDEVSLFTGVSGKVPHLILAGLTGNLPSNVQLAWKSGGTYVACSTTLTPAGSWQNFGPDDNAGGSTPSKWFAGPSGYGLVARIVTSAGTQSGVTCRIEIAADRL